MAHTDRLTADLPGTWQLPRLGHLPKPAWLPTALLVFMVAGFVLPSGAAYAWPFYLLVVPAWLERTAFGARAMVAPFRAPGPALASALLLWSGLTLVWGHDDGHRTWRFAGEVVWTAIFVAALVGALAVPELRRRLGTAMIWVGSANALLSLLLGQVTPQDGERLHGWGITTHPILGAIVMAGAYFCALSRALTEARHRWAHVAACGAMAGFILMTESRGPMLSALLGTLLLCAAGPWRRRALAALAVMGIGWLLLPTRMLVHQESRMLYRGSSHHFQIWDRALAMIAQRPLFGHGLAANLTLAGGITFPHDLYLSVLFYSGAVGFVLFAALCTTVTWRLWQERDLLSQDWLWMTALWMTALLSGLTDLGQITKGPGPMWLIFWLPVCLVLTSSGRPDRKLS